jgi:hypothetical protein
MTLLFESGGRHRGAKLAATERALLVSAQGRGCVQPAEMLVAERKQVITPERRRAIAAVWSSEAHR